MVDLTCKKSLSADRDVYRLKNGSKTAEVNSGVFPLLDISPVSIGRN